MEYGRRRSILTSSVRSPSQIQRQQRNRRNGPMGLETVPEDKGTILAEKRTDLAMQRTSMAAERSLMAWVRTSLSMIGFGFSIYKFFQYLPEELATGNIKR